MPVRIFVSYSHRDAALVTPVVKLLRIRDGLVFQDQDRIEPGRQWQAELDRALVDANLVIVFWCRHSNESAEVRKEYEAAVSKGKDLLPVLLDPTPLPQPLAAYQWIDFQGAIAANHEFAEPAQPRRSAPRRGAWLAVIAAMLVVAAAMYWGLTSRHQSLNPPIANGASKGSSAGEITKAPPVPVDPSSESAKTRSETGPARPLPPAGPYAPKRAPAAEPSVIADLLPGISAWALVAAALVAIAGGLVAWARSRKRGMREAPYDAALPKRMADEIAAAIFSAPR
jgi:hypothetical protein